MTETNRYERQIRLREIGEQGQDKLARASVLVVGAGGLGCPVLQYLAGAGVGTIGIIDHDSVALTNLHRQILFRESDIGQNKADAARAHLLQMNSDISIKAYNNKLEAQNAEDVLAEFDIIIDGTDNFEATYLINDICVKSGKAMIYGSVSGFEGQTALLNHFEGAPCYRCIYPQSPVTPIMNCAEAGILGAAAGHIGVRQAFLALDFILGLSDTSSPSLYIWNGLSDHHMRLGISQNPACPVCRLDAKEIKSAASHPADLPVVSLDQARNMNARLIDVREIDEWENGYIEGAVHIPLSRIYQKPGSLSEIDVLHDDRARVLYCQKGIRSRQAGEMLKQYGFKNIYLLDQS